MKFQLDGREVQIDGLHGTPNEELLIDEAVFVDSGESLSDEQLDNFINIYYSELNEDLYSTMVDRAHDDYKDSLETW